MDMNLVMSAMSMKAAQTQQLASIAIMKKQHEMQMSLVQMIDEIARSAPPPGTGAVVDKSA